MSDSGNEGDQPGTSMERDDEEPLQGWERIRGAEELMDELIPWLDEAFEAQARQREGRGEGSPGTQSSLSAEGGPNGASLLEESISQISISGSGALSPEEKRFLCRQCGKRFARHYNLDVHQRTHTGEKPHRCPVCSKTFADRSNCMRHQRIHTEKPYQCSVCGRSFRHIETLQEHQRSHTGENPYTCSKCGKSFSSWESLRQHRTNSLEAGGGCSGSQAERGAGAGGEAL